MTGDRGVILINVLVALALGAAIVVLMFTSQETLLDRTRRAAAATQAEALALGGETSVRVALARDMMTAPDADHYAEPWALAAQEEVTLQTGTFQVRIEDLRGRFDLNVLSLGGLAQQQMFARLGKAVGLEDRVTLDIIRQMVSRGPVTALRDLRDVSDRDMAALAPHVSLLSTRGLLNVNTADHITLEAILGSASGTRQLLKQRDRMGFLTREDLAAAGILAMTGVGFTSDAFDVVTTAQVDGTSVTIRSRILRQTKLGRDSVAVVARTFGPDPVRLSPIAPPAL